MGSVCNSLSSDPAPTTVMIDLTLEEDSPRPQGPRLTIPTDHLIPEKKMAEDVQTAISKIEEQNAEVEPKDGPRVNVPKVSARAENKLDDNNVTTKTFEIEKKNTRVESKDLSMDLRETTKEATIRPVPQEPETNSEHVGIYAPDMERDIGVSKGLSEDSNERYANQIPRIEKMPPPPPKKAVAAERKVDFDLPESRFSEIQANKKNHTGLFCLMIVILGVGLSVYRGTFDCTKTSSSQYERTETNAHQQAGGRRAASYG